MRTAPTLMSRRKKLSEMVESAQKGSEAEQDKVAKLLSRLVETDPIFLIRIEATRLLGELKTPSAVGGLDIASRDPDPDVRKAAVKAWKARGDETAIGRLQGLVASDTNLDVRLAATRALGYSTSAASVKSLAMVLDDPNPAVQFRATESLARATGQKFGADVKAWKKYLASHGGESPPAQLPPTGNFDFPVQQTSGTEEIPQR